jgi:hypothetical protein
MKTVPKVKCNLPAGPSTFKVKLKVLLDGGLLYTQSYFYRLSDHGLERSTPYGALEWSDADINLQYVISQCNDIEYVEVVQPWNETIPKNGILCWACIREDREMVRIIPSDPSDPVMLRSDTGVYYNISTLSPLTKAEILEFVHDN